jgi:hypothetical protein
MKEEEKETGEGDPFKELYFCAKRKETERHKFHRVIPHPQLIPKFMGFRRKELNEPGWQLDHLKQDETEEQSEKNQYGLKERGVDTLLNQTRIRGVLSPSRGVGSFREEGALQNGRSKYPERDHKQNDEFHYGKGPQFHRAHGHGSEDEKKEQK